jgi:hypothetical protein
MGEHECAFGSDSSSALHPPPPTQRRQKTTSKRIFHQELLAGDLGYEKILFEQKDPRVRFYSILVKQVLAIGALIIQRRVEHVN